MDLLGQLFQSCAETQIAEARLFRVRIFRDKLAQRAAASAPVMKALFRINHGDVSVFLRSLLPLNNLRVSTPKLSFHPEVSTFLVERACQKSVGEFNSKRQELALNVVGCFGSFSDTETQLLLAKRQSEHTPQTLLILVGAGSLRYRTEVLNEILRASVPEQLAALSKLVSNRTVRRSFDPAALRSMLEFIVFGTDKALDEVAYRLLSKLDRDSSNRP